MDPPLDGVLAAEDEAVMAIEAAANGGVPYTAAADGQLAGSDDTAPLPDAAAAAAAASDNAARGGNAAGMGAAAAAAAAAGPDGAAATDGGGETGGGGGGGGMGDEDELAASLLSNMAAWQSELDSFQAALRRCMESTPAPGAAANSSPSTVDETGRGAARLMHSGPKGITGYRGVTQHKWVAGGVGVARVRACVRAYVFECMLGPACTCCGSS